MKKMDTLVPLEWEKRIKEFYAPEILEISTRQKTNAAYEALLDGRGYDTIASSLGIQKEFDAYIIEAVELLSTSDDRYLKLSSDFNILVIYKICTLDGLVCPVPKWDPTYPFQIPGKIKRMFKNLYHDDMLQLAIKNGREKEYKMIVDGVGYEKIAEAFGETHMFTAYTEALFTPEGRMRSDRMELINEFEQYFMAKICFPKAMKEVFD